MRFFYIVVYLKKRWAKFLGTSERNYLKRCNWNPQTFWISFHGTAVLHTRYCGSYLNPVMRCSNRAANGDCDEDSTQLDRRYDRAICCKWFFLQFHLFFSKYKKGLLNPFTKFHLNGTKNLWQINKVEPIWSPMYTWPRKYVSTTAMFFRNATHSK